MISFGYGIITCQQHPADSHSVSEIYAEMLALGDAAERLGYDALWFSEHHFFDDSYLPSVLPACAAVAARTTRLRVGTALALAPLYDPVRLAEDAATVDLISGGRLNLGLGLGWRDEELAAFGVEPASRGRQLEETVAILRDAWSEDGVVTGGELHSYPGVSVTPKPPAPGPPVWIGGTREVAVRRAGRIADGYMAPYESGPDQFMRQLEWAREELAQRPAADQARFCVSTAPPTLAWTDGDAWETLWPFQAYVQGKYAQYMKGGWSTPGSAERSHSVCGRPEEVLERVIAYGELVGGPCHFIARLYWPGMDPGMRLEAMAIFADAVATPARRHFHV